MYLRSTTLGVGIHSERIHISLHTYMSRLITLSQVYLFVCVWGVCTRVHMETKERPPGSILQYHQCLLLR